MRAQYSPQPRIQKMKTIKDALVENGLFAKKSLGQHFLLDLNLTAKIARLAAIDEGDIIFEIGPGPGGLTNALLNSKASKIIAIEKDTRFCEHLRDFFGDFGDKLEIIEGDALKLKPFELMRDRGLNGNAKIIANLPYNVGTQILINWLNGEERKLPMYLMFQTEVARRICATTGDSEFGRLAILAQAIMNARIAMHVPRMAFLPPPKVESAIVELLPKKDVYPHINELGKVTHAAFGQRRKMLRSSLSSLGNAIEICRIAQIDETKRPENLTQNEFYALTDAFIQTSSRSNP